MNTGVHASAHGADVYLRDITIARDGKRGYTVRMTSGTGSTRRILEDFEKVRSSDETCLGRRRLAFACSRTPLWRVPHEMGAGRGKSQNRKIMPPSPYVEEPLNSKVIKSFVPEQRSRYMFFEFRVSYVLCYRYMNIICPFRISVYGYGTYIYLLPELGISVSWVWYDWVIKETIRLRTWVYISSGLFRR